LYFATTTIAGTATTTTSALTIIGSTGNVGIGTTSPKTILQVAGDITPNTDDLYDIGNATYRWDDVYATNGIIQTSDIRLKTNIADISYGLSDIMKLRPISFTWINKAEKGNQLGLIAQEVQSIIPEVVDVGNDANQTLGLRYEKFVPVLVRAIQELDAKVSLLSNIATTTAPSSETGLISALIQGVLDAFKNFYHLVIEDGLLKIAHIITDKLTTKELCVGDTCVNEEQLKILLEKNGLASPVAPVSPQEPAPSPEPIPEPAPVAEPTSAPASPAGGPESTPAPTPVVEPAPAVEPTPVESVPVAAAPTE
jgi:hypothetical protein